MCGNVDVSLLPTAAVNGQSPLSLACANGHLKVTKYFVEEQHCDPKGIYVCLCAYLDVKSRVFEIEYVSIPP